MKEHPDSIWFRTRDLPGRMNLGHLFQGGPIPVLEVKQMLVEAYLIGRADEKERGHDGLPGEE